mgnify:CR=1 FL=1
MNFEVLKRSHIKRNIIVAVIIILILSAIILTFTKAKYKTTASIPLVNGAINYDLSDLNLIGAYIQEGEEYKQVNEIPLSGYEFNEEKSYCTVNGENINATINFDIETQTLSVVPLTKKGTKCYLYFDEKASGSETILAHYSTVLTRTSFSSTVTNTTTGTIYKSANESQYDDDGEVYYFAGNPTDNWVQFGTNSSGKPLYWRIVRINGDGSVRLIYNGTSTATTGNSTMINTGQAFNSSYNDNAYVGYMYKSGEVHGLATNSNIKTILDNWYLANLSDEAEYLDGNAGFCGDRYPSTSSSSSNGSGGIGTTKTYYAYIRLYINKSPSFKCADSQDLYTTPGSSKGNGALKVSSTDETPTPIGLITADEVAFAGGVDGSINRSYYLYNKATYWTMSPYYFFGGDADVFVVYEFGSLSGCDVYASRGVRPVINIRSDVAITGSGTTTDPFRLVS